MVNSMDLSRHGHRHSVATTAGATIHYPLPMPICNARALPSASTSLVGTLPGEELELHLCASAEVQTQSAEHGGSCMDFCFFLAKHSGSTGRRGPSCLAESNRNAYHAEFLNQGGWSQTLVKLQLMLARASICLRFPVLWINHKIQEMICTGSVPWS